MKPLLLTALLCLSSPLLADTRDFQVGDAPRLRTHHDGPFLLLLWSRDCPPCHRELAAVGELLTETPSLPVVLLNTDAALPRQEVERLLAGHGVDSLPSYQFDDPVPARLRRELDPHWHGELPRSYFHDGNGKRRGHSGRLTEDQLRTWRDRLRPERGVR